MGNKENMKFIRTSNKETANKLRYAGFTELTEQTNGTYCFLNDGKKLNFDVEKFDGVYTNIMCL